MAPKAKEAKPSAAALAKEHARAVAGGVAATWTATAEVAAWPRNPKDHTAEHVAEIAGSLARFGWSSPLVANARSGQLVAGHGRLLAAQSRGEALVPVRWVDLDEAEAELLALAENRIQERGGYVEEKLAEILRRRAEKDHEGLRTAGFDEAAVAVILARNAGAPVPTPETEWRGMPEFEQRDANSAFHVTVHFATEADAEAFFALIGQTKRSSTWWPKPDGHVGSSVKKQYVADDGEKAAE